MTINSKRKGNSWELEFSKILTENFKGVWKRAPMSGAIFGASNRHRAEGVREDAQEILSGDLISPKDWPFSVECKSYKELEFHQIIKGQCKKLDDWITQGESDSEFCKKKLFIAIKIVRKGCFVLLEKEGVTYLPENYILYKDKYMMFTLEEFLKNAHKIKSLKDFINN
jgi:hypothetical protein